MASILSCLLSNLLSHLWSPLTHQSHSESCPQVLLLLPTVARRPWLTGRGPCLTVMMPGLSEMSVVEEVLVPSLLSGYPQ